MAKQTATSTVLYRFSQALTNAAHSVDTRGKRPWHLPPTQARALARRAGYTAAIVFISLLLQVVHNLTAWQAPFVTPAFDGVLWAIDLALGAGIFVNAARIVYDPPWFRRLTEIVADAFSFVGGFVVLQAFPFTFGGVWADLVRLALTLFLVGIVVGIVVQSFLLIVAPNRERE